MDILTIEQNIVAALKTVYDPEIPVDIYNLGLIYNIDVADDFHVDIDMTLTAPNCPLAAELVADARNAVMKVTGVKSVDINLVFDPPWSKDMLSETAALELGFI